MDRPELLYAKSPMFPNEVAWGFSFVPTFEKEKPRSAKMILAENEQPKSTVL